MTEDLFRHLRANTSVSDNNDTNLLEDYVNFVDEVTSDQSKYFGDMVEALQILQEQGVWLRRTFARRESKGHPHECPWKRERDFLSPQCTSRYRRSKGR